MSFKDTFTKDDQKEGLLGYDDTAFYYFFSSVVVTIAVPWTCSMIYNALFPGQVQVEKDFPSKTKSGSRYRYCQSSAMVEKVDQARKGARALSTGSQVGWAVKLAVLGGMWLTLYLIHLQIGDAKEIKRFDPFEILEVSPGASAAEVKKAYRQLSLKYHPDKNPDDPLAASRFMQITKAHNALTDETAKANYEKYGNPDGPQTSKVGIGLPRFLLEKENHLMILCLFFFLLLFVVPMAFICYYQRTKNYAANGVMIETLQFMGYYINEATRLKNCPELLAASAESRGMALRPSDNEELKTLGAQVTEHKKRQFKLPIIIKNDIILLAHMQRLHHLMSPSLREDLDEILRHSLKISQAMIEIACMREWFFTAQAMIEFRRSLIQALDVKSSQLLQIPHFNDEILKHCLKGKNATSTLADYLQKDPEQRKGLSSMTADQIADVEAFASHCSNMECKAITEVEDEKEIVVGDIATVTVQLLRKNLHEGETTPLDMSQFMEEPPNQPVEYRLIGLIQHIGSMGGGHYIAYCQHKRRAQDWYEFDDVQVNPVMPEQVERAEPYVLFYQRVPTRAAKFERQTFKKDMRGMQERINQYLLSMSRCRPQTSMSDRSSEDTNMQALQEEIRNQGPALRNLFISPAPELDMAFVSKHWYVRLTTMSRPGPLDNKEYLCPHGKLGYSSAELASEPFFPISKNLSSQLISLYGGGPEITSLENCPKCQAHILAYNLRKQAEYEMVTRYDTKDTGDGRGWYLVDADWVDHWKRYVKSEPVTNYWDMCSPGPIQNEKLFKKEDPKQTRDNLRLKADYIGVNACVWWLFMHVHGGGPPVVRNDLEMPWQEISPETHLLPDELRPKEGDDFYMRTSREFVEECGGDEELYKSLYGTKHLQGDASPDSQQPDTSAGDAENVPDVELTEEAATAAADADATVTDSRPDDLPDGSPPRAKLPEEAVEVPAVEPLEPAAEAVEESAGDLPASTSPTSAKPPSDAVMQEMDEPSCQEPQSSS